MKIIYEKGKEGIRILRCFGYDGQIQLPEKIGGLPVTELGPYLFAETVRRQTPGEKYLAEADGEEEEGAVWAGGGVKAEDGAVTAEALKDGTPALKGENLVRISLPAGLKKIGAYAFYLCVNLEQIEFYGGLKDLGAGLFTGCHKISRLDIRMEPEEKSCLKEVLAELRQALWVNLRDRGGAVFARLLFPEYYEESIENTPARILTQEMHGCGHRYRNAFAGTQFQYLVYDKLFPHIKVQEKPELVTEMVLGRLMYPAGLLKEQKNIYEEYASGHGREIYLAAEKEQDMGILRFAARAPWCSPSCLEAMIEEGNRNNHAQALGILMDIRHKRKEEAAAKEEQEKILLGNRAEREKGQGRKRRFEL